MRLDVKVRTNALWHIFGDKGESNSTVTTEAALRAVGACQR
jgi:hypothetical protein